MSLLRVGHPRMRWSIFSLLALVFPLAACTGADVGADEKDMAAPLQGGGAPRNAAATVTGKVVDAIQRTAVVGATVMVEGITAQTDSAGRFSFVVPTGIAARPSITRVGYAQRLFETVSATGDADLGTLPMLSLSIQAQLRSFLGDYDPSLGAVAVRVLPRGSCPTEAGATVSVSPAGSSKIAYFRNGLPARGSTDVQAGEETSALVYNVATAQPLALTVARAGCSMATYPVTDHGVTRTGAIFASKGDSLTFATGFLE
ncbi:carboxypeptidase-like regulatory domain-containing protein [Pendulispora rubella]|uniref:Carboxypeptidase-like regulatory domain-containing protein n=1 Tax=Pendulispora rubella TaxID=2741070 RepID=A0ABZ2L3I0_9BACT